LDIILAKFFILARLWGRRYAQGGQNVVILTGNKAIKLPGFIRWPAVKGVGPQNRYKEGFNARWILRTSTANCGTRLRMETLCVRRGLRSRGFPDVKVWPQARVRLRTCASNLRERVSVAERNARRGIQRARRRAKLKDFRPVARNCHAVREIANSRIAKHAAQWINTLGNLRFSCFGKLPVAQSDYRSTWKRYCNHLVAPK